MLTSINKNLALALVLALSTLSLMAQNPREEITQDVCRAGSNYMAYPTPTRNLSPAPQGKTPFYISHYGRHGSRYLDSRGGYYDVFTVFQKADSAAVLTDKGQEVLQKLTLMCRESNLRYGELTELGAQQHRQIAHRMYERFPEVFAGDVTVDAKSTIIIRCILSMENELLELTSLNPHLNTKSDASMHDMYYMNFDDRQLFAHRSDGGTDTYFDNWEKEHLDPSRLISSLFTDPSFVTSVTEPMNLYRGLFSLATIVQDSEIRHTLSLYDIFTPDEIYTLWERNNLWWFCNYGPNELNGATQPFSQRNLLSKIIAEADSCLALDKPGATLRFGHETIVLPLTCLLNLNGYGNHMHPSKILENNWVNYRIYPMACNIQFIFYRANPQDDDIWVKVLLNEEEATLPLTAVEGPYYRWSDVRQYYTSLIDNFKYN